MSEVWKLYDKWLYITNPSSVLFGKRACLRRAKWHDGSDFHKYCPHLEVEGYNKYLISHVPTDDIKFLELMDHIPNDKMAAATLKLMVGESGNGREMGFTIVDEHGEVVSSDVLPQGSQALQL